MPTPVDGTGGAHYDHVALYVGNGQAVHGGWNGYSVALASAMTEKLTMWCVSRDAVLLIDLLQASGCRSGIRGLLRSPAE